MWSLASLYNFPFTVPDQFVTERANKVKVEVKLGYIIVRSTGYSLA